MTNLERVLQEQRAFEKWITEETCLGYKFLEGWRDEHGVIDYNQVDAKNKWSGWLAARAGLKAWEDHSED